MVESGPLVGKDGSGKDDRADGKLRWDLLPLAEIEDIVRVYTVGAEKYKADSWKTYLKDSRDIVPPYFAIW